MGLKIEHLDENHVRGELDGFFPFTITREGKSLIAKVAGWTHEMTTDVMDGICQMRSATYTAVAKYRDHQRDTANTAGENLINRA